MKNWLLASRPKTLSAALVPVTCATALAHFKQGVVRWELSILALLGAIFIQVGTNLVNDAADFEKGTDTPQRLGPTRVTQSGLLSAALVKKAAALSFVLAALCGIPLIVVGGWPIVAIGVFSILAGYAYTAGPYPLAYHGLGELFVILFFGVVAVGGTYYLHTKVLHIEALFLGVQVGLLSSVLISINNFRDIQEDQRNHKKTLAVRLGPRFMVAAITAFALLPLLASLYWVKRGLVYGWFPLLLIPLALFICFRVQKLGPSRELNSCLAQASFLNLLFAIVFCLSTYLR